MTKHGTEASRRNQILLAARSVFVEKGYLSARVDDVAKKAGLSKGAVYFYFRSKRELFLALVRVEQEETYKFLKNAEGDDRRHGFILPPAGVDEADWIRWVTWYAANGYCENRGKTLPVVSDEPRTWDKGPAREWRVVNGKPALLQRDGTFTIPKVASFSYRDVGFRCVLR